LFAEVEAFAGVEAFLCARPMCALRPRWFSKRSPQAVSDIVVLAIARWIWVTRRAGSSRPDGRALASPERGGRAARCTLSKLCKTLSMKYVEDWLRGGGHLPVEGHAGLALVHGSSSILLLNGLRFFLIFHLEGLLLLDRAVAITHRQIAVLVTHADGLFVWTDAVVLYGRTNGVALVNS